MNCNDCSGEVPFGCICTGGPFSAIGDQPTHDCPRCGFPMPLFGRCSRCAPVKANERHTMKQAPAPSFLQWLCRVFLGHPRKIVGGDSVLERTELQCLYCGKRWFEDWSK